MNENGLKWHQATPMSLCQHLHTNAACGLSRKAARSRFKKQGRNPLFDDTTPKRQSHIKNLLLDPSILLMLFGALLAVIFLSILQVVCIIGSILFLIAVLWRFWHQCDELSRITAQYRTPTVRVLRDGKVLKISAARVVVGDVLLFGTGDIVPGDCRLLNTRELRVLTLLPDENGHPTYKEYSKNADIVYPYGSRVDAPLAENMLYGGSEILCGEAKAILVAIGTNSYLGAMQSFALPAEIKEKRGDTPLSKILNPYLRAWGFLSLALATLLTVIGLFTKPTEGGLVEYFLILYILAAAASPAIITLYLKWISVRGRLLCMENDPPKNRAVIKSESGVGKLASLTDLFVVGKRGLCDGVTHFLSAFVAGKEIRTDSEDDKTVLQPLCEAMLLRHETDMRTPDCGYSFSNNDSVFLSELVSLCHYDVGALGVRLQAIARDTYPQHTSWQYVTARVQEETVRFLFDNSGTLMRYCMLYTDGKRMRAITPEYRSVLRKYCEYIEENGCRTLCVAEETLDGTIALVGVLAVREQVSAVLPSVVEELSQSGITTRFFLSDDDYARVCRLPEPYLYANAEHPNLTLALLQRYRTFIGFGKEELSALLPTYQKNGHRIAVLGGNADDRCFLRAGILTFACDTVTDLGYYAENRIEEAITDEGKEGSHNTSQVLRRHADVIIERADRFWGGVYAALQTVSHSRQTEARTQMLLQFWLHSQLARMIMMIFAVCTGVGVFSVLQMCLSAFAVEIAALCFLADVPIAQSALRRPCATDGKFISKILLSAKALSPVVLSATVTAILPGILTFSGVITKAMTQTYLFFSLFLLQMSILIRIAYRAKAMPQRKTAAIFAVTMAGSAGALTLLSSVIPTFGLLTGMGTWMPLTAILLLLSPALYYALALILPFFNRTAK